MRNATFRRQRSLTIQEFEMRRHWKVVALPASALSGWASYAAAPAVERQAHGVTVRFDTGVVRLEVWSDRIVRVTYAKGAEIPAMQSLSVNSAPAAVPFEVKLLRDFGQPNLDLTIDRRQAARFGINVTDIQDAVQTAVGGNAVSQVLINEQRYDVVVRFQQAYRNTSKAIENVRLLSPAGERVSLAQLTKVDVKDGAYDIFREGNSRYVAVTFNVRGRDLGTTVEEAIKAIHDKVKMPPGYRVAFSGEYESEKRAEARLRLIVPLTLLVIFIILY